MSDELRRHASNSRVTMLTKAGWTSALLETVERARGSYEHRSGDSNLSRVVFVVRSIVCRWCAGVAAGVPLAMVGLSRYYD